MTHSTEGAGTVEQLDTLSTEELRHRAFAKAEHARDVGFFWDLLKHLPEGESLSADDGSLGGLSEGLSGAIALATHRLGEHETALEPLLRARYIDYLS
jgi:hypothetical protein